MRGTVGSLMISRLAAAAVAVWLCGTGSAWAGGGMDLGSLQLILNGVCSLLGMTTCPQLPTITQVILELAALENSPPDLLRANSDIKICTVSGLPINGSINVPPCKAVVVDAVNRPASSPVGLSDLSALDPLAFISPLPGQGPALPVQPGTSGENSFFYAVATGANGQPDTLQLFYDYVPRTTAGQFVANVSLQLQVLNKDGSERWVQTTLTITANCTGSSSCSASTIASGDFLGTGTPQQYSGAQLGLNPQVFFGASPNSAVPHAILEVPVSLLVTGPAKPAQCGKAISAVSPDPTDCGNDPAYFGVTPAGASNGSTPGSPTGINQVSGLPTAFATNATGFSASVLKGAAVGIAPYAAPPCTAATCPSGTNPPPPAQSFFSSCASVASRPAVAAFFAMGTDGTTYISAPTIPQPPPSPGTTSPPPAKCPF
jgi:hypothetical protein